jgi:phenylalanyl-tRNA synthetase beta chain
LRLTGFKPAAKPSPKIPSEEKKYLVVVRAAKDSDTFYELKGTLDHLFESLGMAEHWYDDALTRAERQKAHALHPQRMAKVMADNDFLGIVAELHPATAENLKAKGRIVFAELDFEKLWRLARAEAEFRPIGKYPAIVRDIAVIVPEETKADEIEGVIQNSGGKLLVDSDLFDYFQDKAMSEAGEKSLAFHLIFQSPGRTLTDAEVNRLCKKIATAVKAKGWEVRG